MQFPTRNSFDFTPIHKTLHRVKDRLLYIVLRDSYTIPVHSVRAYLSLKKVTPQVGFRFGETTLPIPRAPTTLHPCPLPIQSSRATSDSEQLPIRSQHEIESHDRIEFTHPGSDLIECINHGHRQSRVNKSISPHRI